MHKITRVLLGEHSEIARVGLRVILEDAGMVIVGEARNGQAVLEQALKLSPDLVVLNLAMPRLNGCEATLRVTRECPSIRVLGLMKSPAHRTAHRFLRVGGFGLLLTNCARGQLVQAVTHLARGEMYLAPELASIILRDFTHQGKLSSDYPLMQLTDHECEILRLVSDGKSIKDIADHLAISVKTAHTHRQNITAKLRVRGVADLTRYALREGISEL